MGFYTIARFTIPFLRQRPKKIFIKFEIIPNHFNRISEYLEFGKKVEILFPYIS